MNTKRLLHELRRNTIRDYKRQSDEGVAPTASGVKAVDKETALNALRKQLRRLL